VKLNERGGTLWSLALMTTATAAFAGYGVGVSNENWKPATCRFGCVQGGKPPAPASSH
jgi:hypothetical protein